MKSHVRESILRSYIGSLMQITENKDGSKSVTMSPNAEDIIYTRIPSCKVKLDHWTIKSDETWSVRAVLCNGDNFTVDGINMNDCIDKVLEEIDK